MQELRRPRPVLLFAFVALGALLASLVVYALQVDEGAAQGSPPRLTSFFEPCTGQEVKLSGAPTMNARVTPVDDTVAMISVDVDMTGLAVQDGSGQTLRPTGRLARDFLLATSETQIFQAKANLSVRGSRSGSSIELRYVVTVDKSGVMNAQLDNVSGQCGP